VSAAEKPRRSGTGLEPAAAGTAASAPVRAEERPRPQRPFLLDFFPLEGESDTRLARFYERLRSGRLSTTRCPNDGEVHWPPRVACPRCHRESLEWVDLPEAGTVYAFSAVLGGAPLGMESDVPYVVGLVDLDGGSLRLFGRIEGATWDRLTIGQAVRVEAYDIGDGRQFYRFRATR
jgi:uncharacterized protein